MKREIIVLCLLLGMTAASLHSYGRVDRVCENMARGVDEALEILDRRDRDALSGQINGLVAQWKDGEGSLVHYVRHSRLDEVSQRVARLSALAGMEEFAELGAELGSIRWQLEDILRSETPSWKALF